MFDSLGGQLRYSGSYDNWLQMNNSIVLWMIYAKYGAVSAGPPPPSPPMGCGGEGFPLFCGVGAVCGIVVVYRLFPPLWCGGGL